jgi:hypothetical protein
MLIHCIRTHTRRPFNSDNAASYDSVKRMEKILMSHDFNFEFMKVTSNKLSFHRVQRTIKAFFYVTWTFDNVIPSYFAKDVDLNQFVADCWRVLKPSGIAFEEFACQEGFLRCSLWNLYSLIIRIIALCVGATRIVFVRLKGIIICQSRWINRAEEVIQEHRYRDNSCNQYILEIALVVGGKKA